MQASPTLLVESESVAALEPRRQLQLLPGHSRDEMNLAEFPLTVLSTRADPSLKTLEFRDQQRLKNGDVVEREWIITAADKFGLPTSTDDDVLLGLMRLTMDQGFRARKIYFTRYELMRILRWSTEGRSYSRLTKSLDRLSGVRIRATNAFFDNAAKAYQTCNFGVIDAYEINDERGGKGTSGSFFIWSEVLFDSFKAGFIKKIDLDLYFSLRSAVSRRLYRYLDKHFYYKPSLEKPLLPLAFEKLGLSRSYKYVSSVKQQLEPAAEELVERGFLRDFEFAGRGEGTVVRFHAAVGMPAAAQISGKVDEQPLPVNGLRKKLGEMLVQRGINRRQVGKLLDTRTDDELQRIARIVSYYDHLVHTNDQKISKNKIGFLYRAVENPFRFTLPMEPEPQKTNAPRSGRPELRVFRAARSEGAKVSRHPMSGSQQTFDLGASATTQAAQGSSDQKTPDTASTLAASVSPTISEAIEKKVGPLQSLLGEAEFRELIKACIKEEINRSMGKKE